MAHFHRETKQGRYDRNDGLVMRRITGQTLGIVGLGRIGRELCDGQPVLGCALSVRLCEVQHVRQASSLPDRLEAYPTRLPWPQLLAESDYVSLHMPLTPETHHLIDAGAPAAMKPSAYLINTARGGLVDNAALASALAAGKLAGAALDVQEPEPPDPSQPP